MTAVEAVFQSKEWHLTLAPAARRSRRQEQGHYGQENPRLRAPTTLSLSAKPSPDCFSASSHSSRSAGLLVMCVVIFGRIGTGQPVREVSETCEQVKQNNSKK